MLGYFITICVVYDNKSDEYAEKWGLVDAFSLYYDYHGCHLCQKTSVK